MITQWQAEGKHADFRPGSNPNQRYSPMAQANSNNNITALVVPSRRLFLSQAAGLAAGGTVLAMAIKPAPAAAAMPTDLALSAAKASPALRTAITALNESSDRLKAAKVVFEADDLRMVEWSENHPKPKNGRALKKHWRKWRDQQIATTSVSWKALLDVEKDFRDAMIAVARVAPR